MDEKTVSPVTKSDIRRIWEIRNCPTSRRSSLNQQEIPFEKHISWFIKKYFEDKSNYCFTLKNGAEVIGYCRFDLDETGNYRTSIAIDPELLGRGLGTFLLKESLSKLTTNKKILAEIKKDNEASIGVFVKNGFIKVSEDENNLYFERGGRVNQQRIRKAQ